MKNEKVIFLCQNGDLSNHRLAKYIDGHLGQSTVIDINYLEPLQKLFSEIIIYDYIRRITEVGVKGINDEIIELVKKERPKYVVWLRNMYELLESTTTAIKNEGSKIVGLFVDDEYRFAYYSKWWIPYMDYIVTFDFEAVPKYKVIGAPVIFAFGCEGTPIEIDWSNIEEKYEVSFVGGKAKSGRESYFNALKERNISVSMFGKGWEGGYVSTEEMINIFTTSKINLNFSGAGRRTGVKGRLTFVMLAGGFLLTEYTPGLEKYFQFNKEIVCFRNAEEMIEKINYYLSHDDERRAIARAGWERAVKEYTPFHMFSRIFDEVENYSDAAGSPEEMLPGRAPLSVRIGPSRYYFQWGRGFLEEGYDDRWRDALSLAVSYNPFNIAARYYLFIGLLPSFLRPLFFKFYLPFSAAGRLCNRLYLALISLAEYIPLLRDMKRGVSRGLSYS